jgi:hypothetical protein
MFSRATRIDQQVSLKSLPAFARLTICQLGRCCAASMHKMPIGASMEKYSMVIISLAFRLFVEPTVIESRKELKCNVIEIAGATALEVHDRRLSTSAGARAGAVVVEPLLVHNEPLLAMTIAQDGPAIRVNGLAAGPVRMLRIADVIEFPDEGPALHVTLFQRPFCGPAQPEHVGRECPICLRTVATGDWVLVCVHCRSVVHERAESGAKSDDSLECARMSPHCPVCSRLLVRKEGYVHVPEI